MPVDYEVMRRLTLALVSLVAVGCVLPAGAAAKSPGPPPDVAPPLFAQTNLSAVPPGFEIDAARAIAVAKTSPGMQAIHRAHHPLHIVPMLWVRNHWEIYFSFHGKVIADQLVSADGKLGPLYTGPLIGALYARGHYGDIFDNPWVLASFTLMFLLPLALLRGYTWLDRIDLAAVLTFGVSYALFDTAHLELGVWAFYPPLVYLMVRMLMRGVRPSRPAARRLGCRLPTAVLVLGLVALVVGRIIVTLHPVGVLDVGTASVLGAYKILHGQSIYYYSLGHGDTYGPLNYLIYVPFELIWPGNWGYLPAARAAAITFDLMTIAGLILVGFRLRRGREGWRLGLLLGWLWAACPFTVLGLVKSTNDGLVALVVVLVMLFLAAPIKRGILVGVGAASKFFPAILLPLVAVGQGDDKPAVRKVLAAFAITVGATIAVFMPSGGLQEMWNHTIGFQLTRSDVFSIWALHPALAPIKVTLEAFAVILAVVVAFRPRGRRTPAQIAALGAALTIAIQLPAMHWFYLYIVWFLPLILIAVLARDPVAAGETHLDAKALGRVGDDLTAATTTAAAAAA